MTSSNSARGPKAEGRLTTPGEEPGAPDPLHPANSLPSASNPLAESQSSGRKKYRWIPGPTHDCDVSGCDSVSHNPDDGSGQRLEVTGAPKSEDPSPESGCAACRAILWDPGDGYTRFRESQHYHHALLRAEKERADRLAKTEATTARALTTALAERDAACREIAENRLIIVGYEHMSENPSPEEAAECECWFCRSRALGQKEGP